MDSIFEYFSHMPLIHKLTWLIFCITLASCLELIIPLRKDSYSKLRQFRINGALLTTTIIINGFMTTFVLMASAFTAEHQFGLLHYINLNAWLEFLIALLVLDLVAQYGIHYLLHKTPILWRFHRVHHSDIHVDATTGTRHHPVDYLLREIFSIAVVFALGLPPEFYALYRVISIFCTYFTHANISLPKKLDKAISYVIVSPNSHKFHHHDSAHWTDSNYGNIFIFWDRIFGTFTYGNVDEVEFGVDTMDNSKTKSIKHLLIVPFQ